MWARTRNALKLVRETSCQQKSDGLNASTDSAYESSPDRKVLAAKGYYEKIDVIGVNGKMYSIDNYRSANDSNNVYHTPDPIMKTNAQEKRGGHQRGGYQRGGHQRGGNQRGGHRRGQRGDIHDKQSNEKVSASDRQKVFGPKMGLSRGSDTKGKNETPVNEEKTKLAEMYSFKSDPNLSNIKVNKKSSDVKITPPKEESSYYRELMAKKSDYLEVKTLLCQINQKRVVSTRPTIRRVVINN